MSRIPNILKNRKVSLVLATAGRPRLSGRGSALGSRPPAFRKSRAGMTLVELLVVVTILVILTGVVIPVLTPSLESRRMRESARQVNLYLNRARSMAMEKKRPVGVWLERRQGLNQAVTNLFIVEELPPTGLDSSNIPRLLVSNSNPQTPSSGSALLTFPGGAPSDLQVGDYLQLNFQGPIWEMITISPVSANQRHCTLRQTGMGPPVPPNIPQPGVPYQIFRTPRLRSLASPLELPSATAIDTQWSGIGVGTLAQAFAPPTTTDTNPILILFSPKGEVDSVWCWTSQSGSPVWQKTKATEPIYLLVGKLNRIPQGEDNLTNWQDLGNLWVVVTPQTGMVRTVEMASGTNSVEARRIARESHSMGGK
ncbi:MAG TPA: prepilin-type N-terminal cleavage/methylation domain-containing protein [Thermoguttaceae bacterium]|nr:prepilin-type N-terminal cleavage/methylation domain-containing protein [Thermoguttaceae bacterium]